MGQRLRCRAHAQTSSLYNHLVRTIPERQAQACAFPVPDIASSSRHDANLGSLESERNCMVHSLLYYCDGAGSATPPRFAPQCCYLLLRCRFAGSTTSDCRLLMISAHPPARSLEPKGFTAPQHCSPAVFPNGSRAVILEGCIAIYPGIVNEVGFNM